MAVVNKAQEAKSVMLRGKLGRPNGLGAFVLGESWIADDFSYSGIYQKRHVARWRAKLHTAGLGALELGDNFLGNGLWQRAGRKQEGEEIVMVRHYIQNNPRTPAQQAWRATFATGVSTWRGLTETQKQSYRDTKYPSGLSGFNRFMREYMQGAI